MKLLAPIVLLVAFASPLAAQAAASPYFNSIQSASWHADIAALQDLSRQLQAAAVNNDPETVYAAALADYRLANAGMKDEKQYRYVIDAALDRAENLLEKLSRCDTKYQAESLALLSSVYCTKIGISPIKGPVLGIKSGSAIAQAEKLAPDNPRVQLFKGLGKLYTPAIFGGDREGAMAAFNAAIAYLPKEQFSASNWGLDDAYIWRGIALKSAGRAAEARASFEQALAIAPESKWIKHLLADTQPETENK